MVGWRGNSQFENGYPNAAEAASTSRRFDMGIKPIRTAQDYKQALQEIEALMTARKGTPECDYLDVLSNLVEDWERRHQTIPAFGGSR